MCRIATREPADRRQPLLGLRLLCQL